MIKIERIEFQNFFSFRKLYHLDIKSNGVHYIYGVNMDADKNQKGSSNVVESVGSGKTSLTYVLGFVFYGKVPKKVKQEEMINKITNADLYAAAIFTVDQHRYKVARYRKHFEHKNDLHLFIEQDREWVDISNSDKKETQKAVEEIILLSEPTFQKTALFSRDNVKNFFELSATDRFSIIENIINMAKFKSLYTRATQQHTGTKKDVDEIYSELTKVESGVDVKVNFLNQMRTEYNNSVARLTETQTKLLEKLAEAEAEQSVIDNFITLLNNYGENATKLSALERNRPQNVNIINSQITESLGVYRKQVESYRQLKPTLCDSCGTPYNKQAFDEAKKALLNQIQGLNRTIKQLNKTKKQVMSDIGQYTLVHQNLTNDIEAQREKIQNFQLATDKKAEILEAISSGRAVMGADQKKSATEAELESVNQSLNDLDYTKIESLEQEILNNRESIIHKKSEYTRLNKTLLMYEWWKKILNVNEENSIKQKILELVIPAFNTVVAEMTEYFFDSSLTLSFDKKMNESIHYNGSTYVYDALSTGERTKLNFCVNFALFELTRLHINGLNVLFFDEIFTNLDYATIRKTLSLIENKFSDNSAVHIISHDQAVRENIQPVSEILVEKLNGESHLSVSY